MYKKILLATAMAVGFSLGSVAPASAATLSLDTTAAGGGSVGVLPGPNGVTTLEFDPEPSANFIGPGLPAIGDNIWFFDSGDSGGLSLNLVANEFARVTYTFLGKEAGFENGAFELTGPQSFDSSIAAGDPGGPGSSATQEALDCGGSLSCLLDFKFTSNDGVNPEDTAQNGSPISPGLSIGWFHAGLFDDQGNIADNVSNVWYALLDDGGANTDQDWDDMVLRIEVVRQSIGEVPLPAPLLLLLSGLLGLGFLGRFRKKTGLEAS